MRWQVVLATFAVMLVSASANAQTDRPLWGITASIAPEWRVPEGEGLRRLFNAETIDLAGSEFNIGFVRGTWLGGDWGVSFVRKSLKEDTGLETKAEIYEFDSADPYVQNLTGHPVVFTFRPSNTTLTGVEFRKFASFGTIAERVQLGMNLAIGVGQLRGQIQRSAVFYNGNDEEQLGSVLAQYPFASIDAKELFQPFGKQLEWVPLGKVEFGVALLVPGADGLKVRFSGGFNMPGTQIFSITGVYLFGAQ